MCPRKNCRVVVDGALRLQRSTQSIRSSALFGLGLSQCGAIHRSDKSGVVCGEEVPCWVRQGPYLALLCDLFLSICKHQVSRIGFPSVGQIRHQKLDIRGRITPASTKAPTVARLPRAKHGVLGMLGIGLCYFYCVHPTHRPFLLLSRPSPRSYPRRQCPLINSFTRRWSPSEKG